MTVPRILTKRPFVDKMDASNVEKLYVSELQVQP
jgi:hypothetical protein